MLILWPVCAPLGSATGIALTLPSTQKTSASFASANTRSRPFPASINDGRDALRRLDTRAERGRGEKSIGRTSGSAERGRVVRRCFQSRDGRDQLGLPMPRWNGTRSVWARVQRGVFMFCLL